LKTEGPREDFRSREYTAARVYDGDDDSKDGGGGSAWPHYHSLEPRCRAGKRSAFHHHRCYWEVDGAETTSRNSGVANPFRCARVDGVVWAEKVEVAFAAVACRRLDVPAMATWNSPRVERHPWPKRTRRRVDVA